MARSVKTGERETAFEGVEQPVSDGVRSANLGVMRLVSVMLFLIAPTLAACGDETPQPVDVAGDRRPAAIGKTDCTQRRHPTSTSTDPEELVRKILRDRQYELIDETVSLLFVSKDDPVTYIDVVQSPETGLWEYATIQICVPE